MVIDAELARFMESAVMIIVGTCDDALGRRSAGPRAPSSTGRQAAST